MKKKLSLKKLITQRLAGGGVLLLSNISLVSIGFSAWSIGASSVGEARLDVSAAGIVDVNNYINYGAATIFNYCKDGIISNDTIVTKRRRHHQLHNQFE